MAKMEAERWYESPEPCRAVAAAAPRITIRKRTAAVRSSKRIRHLDPVTVAGVYRRQRYHGRAAGRRGSRER
jgi:hypothetical protein